MDHHKINVVATPTEGHIASKLQTSLFGTVRPLLCSCFVLSDSAFMLNE